MFLLFTCRLSPLIRDPFFHPRYKLWDPYLQGDTGMSHLISLFQTTMRPADLILTPGEGRRWGDGTREQYLEAKKGKEDGHKK